MTVASPCVGVCTFDPRLGFCTGCGRSTQELVEWTKAKAPRRLEILRLATARLARER